MHESLTPMAPARCLRGASYRLIPIGRCRSENEMIRAVRPSKRTADTPTPLRTQLLPAPNVLPKNLPIEAVQFHPESTLALIPGANHGLKLIENAFRLRKTAGLARVNTEAQLQR